MTFFLLYIEKIICAKRNVINSQNPHVDNFVDKVIRFMYMIEHQLIIPSGAAKSSTSYINIKAQRV